MKRKPARRGTRASVSALQVAQEALGGVTWIWNARRDEVTWFGDLSPLLGLKAHRFTGRFADYLECVHPQDRAAARQTYVECLKRIKPSYRTEERVVWPDGSVHWLETYARARYGRAGRALELCGSVRDCTERVEAERRIARSENLLAKAFNASPNFISVVRLRDGIVLFANAAFAQAVGRGTAEMLGRNIDDFDFWADPAQREAIRQAFADKRPVRDYPLGLRLHDGRVVNCLISSSRIEYEGEPAAVSFAIDVTEELRKRRELAESEQREHQAREKYAALFETSPEGIAVTRLTDGLWVEGNDAAFRQLRIPREQAIGRSVLDLGIGAARPDREAIVATLVAGGRVVNRPTRFRCGDGVWLELLLSAVSMELDGARCVVWSWRDLTELRRAEEKARQSVDHFATVFATVPDPILISRISDGIVLAVNDAWVRVNGYAREQIIGRRSAEVGVYSAAARTELIAELQREGRLTNRLTSFVRADGSERKSLISAAIIQIEGEPCAMMMGRDVSELQKAQDALLESERRYRSLFQAAMDCIMVISPAGTLLDINEVGCRSLGYTHEELRGGSFSRILDETRLRRLLPRPTGVATERRTLRAEQDIRARDGSVRAVEFSAGPLPDGNILVIVRDITERKRQEKLLGNIARGVSSQLGESFLNSLVTHLGRELGADYVLVGQVLPGAERVRTLAYCADGEIAPNFEYPLAGSPCVRAIGQRGTVAFPESVCALFAEDPELRALGVEGYVGTSLHDSRGETTGILVAMTRSKVPNPGLWVSVLEIYAARAAAEIERARAEAEIRELNVSLERRVAERTAALESANRELESFSYSVSHDLRAPLRAITGFTAALRSQHEAELSDVARRLFDRVESNAARMGQLIDDLLAFARAGRGVLSRETLDMRALVGAVLSDLNLPAPAAASIRIGDLPQANGDRALLRQVWENLISNALKFSARVAHPRIEIGGTRSGARVEYHVRDNGAGFDMAYASNLFGVFQRLHSNAEFEGTGVGLAIVQRIVHRHGGEVRAEGETDHGATFRFTLPD